jgi:hypothetical protein
MVSEYMGSATWRLSTAMPIIVVVVLDVVHKNAIQCNIEDFAVKPSIKKKFNIKCHQKFRRWFPGISLALKPTL